MAVNNKNYRWLVVVPLLLALLACGGDKSDCDSDADAASCDASATNNSGSSTNGGGDNNGSGTVVTPEALPVCAGGASSDEDGDGYGYENGASCRVPGSGAQASIADINHIVVVTGQSNVEAPETEFDPVLDAPHPRVFAFTDSGWQIADLHQVWDEHAHPGNHSLTDPTRSPNNNFTFHFGKSLAELQPDAVPAFIVLAAPGKGIANWDYESPFFLKMRNKISNALSQIPNRDTIDVMLWHQGESDAQYEGTSDPDATEFTDEDSEEYKNYYSLKLRKVINNFRSESWARSDLPFICAETRVSFRVNRRLMELNDDGDPNSACIASTDLPYRLSDPSGAHFSAAGLRELGRRYMQKYLQIINR